MEICENATVAVPIGTFFEFSGLDTYPGQFPFVLKETPDARLVISTRPPGVARESGEDHGIIYVHEPREVIATSLELAHLEMAKLKGAKARRFVENMG